MYVRVRDKQSKHEFDVLASDSRIGSAFELVDKKHYPESRYPRPAKYSVASKNVANGAAKPVAGKKED